MTTRTPPLLHHIRRLAACPASASDAALLECFLARRDEAAFAALVGRHGPMVLRVCRRVLGNSPDADDAFQAAFLVLARKADLVRPRSALAGWLHGVAYRVALKARAARARRHSREMAADDLTPSDPHADPLAELSARELVVALDEEVRRLPEAYRLPLVLCCLEGHTQEEVARRLGWTSGAVKGRLERGRRRLHDRLIRRGITLTAALLALSAARGAAAEVPGRLSALTAQAAAGTGAVMVPASVAALAAEGLKGLAARTWKSVLAFFLAAGVIAGGTGAIVPWTLGQGQLETSSQEPPRPAADAADRPAGADLFGDPLPPGAVARLGTVRWRHGGWITAVVVSPDGRTIVSAAGRTIHLWDAATGKERRRLLGHEDDVACVAFTRDGKTLASGSSDNTIRIWDVATGKELRQLKGHQGQVFRGGGGVGWVGFTADGATLISSGGDKTIRIWDVATGKELRQLKGHAAAAWSLALSFDGKMLAAVISEPGKPAEVRLWDVASGDTVRQIALTDQAGSVGFSPDDTLLATTSGEWAKPGVVRLWAVATGKEVRALRGHEHQVYTAVFSPDGKTLATTSYDKTVRLWDVAQGKELRQVGDRPGPFPRVAFTPDGKHLVTWGFDNALRFWDVATGAESRGFDGPRGALSAIAFSPDGRLLATGANTVHLWDRAAGKELRRLGSNLGYLGALGFSLDGKTLAAAWSEGTLSRWETDTGREVGQTRLGKFLSAVSFSPDAKVVGLYEQDAKSLRLCDAATGKELRQLQDAPGWIQSLAFSPDGALVAAGSGADLYLHVWDVATGKKLGQHGKHPGGLTCVTFSPDGRLVVGACLGHSAHLWEVATGQQRLKIQHDGNITALAFSPDGRLLVTANNGRNHMLGPDGKRLNTGNQHEDSVHVWSVADGKELRRFAGHRGAVDAILFSPDGRLLASGSSDTTALLWDVAGTLAPPRPRPTPLPANELESLWADLEGRDAAKAHRASWTLMETPDQAIARLKERLRPVAVADPKRLAPLIADLDSEAFAVRDKAARELERMGESAAPALQKARAESPSPEVRRRVQQLLERLTAGSPGQARALELLEHLGTPDARRLLEALAEGAPEARLTQEARAALARLGRQAAPAP